jgi:hypothetical protein
MKNPALVSSVFLLTLICSESYAVSNDCPLNLSELGNERLSDFVLKGEGGRLEGSAAAFPTDTHLQLDALPWSEWGAKMQGQDRAIFVQPSSKNPIPLPPLAALAESERANYPILGKFADLGNALVLKMEQTGGTQKFNLGLILIHKNVVNPPTLPALLDHEWHTHEVGPNLALATAAFGQDDRFKGTQVIRCHPYVAGEKALGAGIDFPGIAKAVNLARANNNIDQASRGEIALLQCGLRWQQNPHMAPPSLHAPQADLGQIGGETRYLVQWFLFPADVSEGK